MLKRVFSVVFVAVCLSIAAPGVAIAKWTYYCSGTLVGMNNCQWFITTGGPAPRSELSSGKYVPDPVVDPCHYRLIRDLDPHDPIWGGHDPYHGRMWRAYCPVGDFGGRAAGQSYWDRPSTAYYVADGDLPGDTPTIDPQVLVSRAQGHLTIPAPTPAFGPDDTKVAVKVPVWLWVDNADPIIRTTTAGTDPATQVTATVTARLTHTTWDMGEPVNPARPVIGAPPVECDGPGVAYSPGVDRANPPCGYTYIWRSRPERTDGAGTWPVTVTAEWTVTIVITTGATVTDRDTHTVTTESTTPLRVREWRSILVSGLH